MYRWKTNPSISRPRHRLRDPGGAYWSCFFTSTTDIVGRHSAIYEEEVRKIRLIAVEEMVAAAREKGGNAIAGVDVDYEEIRKGMLMVSITGTALQSGRKSGPQKGSSPGL